MKGKIAIDISDGSTVGMMRADIFDDGLIIISNCLKKWGSPDTFRVSQYMWTGSLCYLVTQVYLDCGHKQTGNERTKKEF